MIYVLTVQALGLIFLKPDNFGLFSIQYLLGALAGSVCLSVVAEAWMREEIRTGVNWSWKTYANAATWVSLGGVAVTMAVSLVFSDLRVIAVSGSVAVGLATYRVATRFYDVRKARYLHVVAGDVAGAGLALTVAIGSVAAGQKVGLQTLTWAWIAAGVGPLLLGGWPVGVSAMSARSWVRSHAASIKVLARDSVITDLSGIGTPLMLSPVLGVQGLGVYRAMSNAAAPVRLLVTPLRPALAGVSLAKVVSPRPALLIMLTAALPGIGCWVLLDLVRQVADIGTLTSLSAHSATVGLFVSGTFLLHIFSMFARTNLTGRGLLVGRILQLVLCMGLPLTFATTVGLSGAMVAYASATLCSGIMWCVLLARHVASAV
ncbi:hypothetical protein [Marmoricola endophyticus]|uniref:hypothetical protein n=1 Tax=Marmoricola endophyticus TaxID=2040280 RepID=UPI00166A00B9|nr:hypothetical protein [Marmoricola endophyticus]